ncbi:MAG: HDIG domain-containing protein [Chroococcidiopsidaceae cyanobacterium CP_BM_RX_35]|nr:HDIG domain-containing protein [Chroococcidiopsidaceae cyanobacterium CP_BM_RX_35]
MKTFESMTQQFNQWRRRHQPLNRLFSTKSPAVVAPQTLPVVLPPEPENQSSEPKPPTLNNSQPPAPQHRGSKGTYRLRKDRSSAVVLVAVLSLTGVMGHRYYNQPKLDVGTKAPQTIKAPYTARIKDVKSTEAKRRAALTESTPILMIDPVVNQQIEQDLQQALDLGNDLRRTAGPFPFVETSILSTATQTHLRDCPESEWQAVLMALSELPKVTQESKLQAAIDTQKPQGSLQRIVAELKAYRSQASPQQFSALVAAISQARQRYNQALAKLREPEASKTEILYETSLVELPDAEWQSTQRGIRDATKRILAQGIAPGLPPSVLQQAVSLQVKTLIPPAAETPVVDLLLSVLQPNLKQDIGQTQQQAKLAAAAVQPMFLEVHKGQVIVRAGQIITTSEFLELDYFRLSRREINWLGLIQLGGFIIATVGVFGLVEQRFRSRLRQHDRLLVLLLTLSAPLLVAVGVPYINLPAIGLLLGSFYSSLLGVTVVGLLTVLLKGSLHVSYGYLLPAAAGGLLSSWMAGRLRSREELAVLGGIVGLTQGGVYLLGRLVLGAPAAGPLWYVLVFREAALSGLSGLAWSIVALGLSPYLERLFDLVTPSRLAELANPNRPLLKRLAAKTPGTFQHTMFVATLAEAAAKALECNVELVRAGTLYHDIGKMHDPLSFIENQMGGPNKHDLIHNPWKSAEIIKKHVSEGLVMARKCRLPTAIQAFIPEHQGTMLIAYFYHQAEQLAQQDQSIVVHEMDFRYDGPIPQSRETGIVMLADSCEAALRSLKEASPEQALAMVNKILRARWQDNQLIDSGLTRTEMSQIAEIFVEVWQQFNHKRIAYPKALSK